MKKKITALVLAVSAFMSSTAFAVTVNVENPEDTKAIVMCYDENGVLVYSNLYKSEDGKFSFDIPSEYSDTKKKVYFVDTKEFRNVQITDEELNDVTITDGETPTPSPDAAEEPAETVKPAATTTPTAAPVQNNYPSIYEKAVDALYAPGVVKEVETRSDSDGNEVYAVTVLYHGTEMTIGIETDLTISTAPEAYSFMKGQPVNMLEEGDVICFTANIAGDTIKTVDFIFRPTDEDIVTGTEDYGTSFEKLISENGSTVANKWTVMKYGVKPSSDKYQYAFGIVGKKDSNVLTLINMTGDEDQAIDIDIQNDTIVYTCDFSNKNQVEIGDVGSIQTTISRSAFNDGVADLTSDYSYNYALVRIVDGTATDIVVYNNYNE